MAIHYQHQLHQTQIQPYIFSYAFMHTAQYSTNTEESPKRVVLEHGYVLGKV